MANTRSAEAHQQRAPALDGRLFADVLCAIDGTRRSYAAVAQAAVLAGPQGQLTLVTITAATGSGAFRQALISPSRAERILERAAKIAEQAEVASTTLIDPAGPPQEVLIERAVGRDLLALGAPVGSRLEGMLTGGVAAAALGSFTTPLLAARLPPVGRFPERILVASDGLDGSDRLVELVGRLAQVHQASVILLHVAAAGARSRPPRIQEQARKLEETLEGASELRVEVGRIADVIVELGEEAAVSLTVTGSRRLGGLRALGSVSRQVAHEAHCSVLLIPPELLQG
jgi:nucleotide-binding universal stress UspA family protein